MDVIVVCYYVIKKLDCRVNTLQSREFPFLLDFQVRAKFKGLKHFQQIRFLNIATAEQLQVPTHCTTLE